MFGKKSKGKVFVGLSGGVDSAVSAALLKKEGYDVTGVFIRIALEGYPCTAGQDKLDAMRVATHLKLPFLEVDLSKEYKEEVFRTAVEEFSRGRTPNPDTLCNQKIKFGHFWEFAKSHGADFIATGHYARIASQAASVSLLAGTDPEKDQSYFLWMVPEAVLKHTLFPVGGLKKSQVRTLAQKFGLPNAARPDSQGLCFLGDVTIEGMLERELTPTLGALLDEHGAIVGEHRGAALYTLGQRHGFTLTAHAPLTAPHFVVAKDMTANTVTVSTERMPTGKSKTKVILRENNLVGPFFMQTTKDGEVAARYRYRQKLIPARIDMVKNEVLLTEAHYVPLGQSLVLYDGARCLGGGIVDRTELQ